MEQINKPNSRTFYKVTNGNGVVHEGMIDIDQVLMTGLTIAIQTTNAEDIFTTLPSSGTMTKGDRYSWNGGLLTVEQTHERTIYSPDQTPALFTVYRANTSGMLWVINEKVVIGDQRTYNTSNYKCLQSHLTNYTPDLTPALWSIIAQEAIPVWKQPTGSQDAYNIGDKVHFPLISDPVYESVLKANVWSPSAYPAAWKLKQIP